MAMIGAMGRAESGKSARLRVQRRLPPGSVCMPAHDGRRVPNEAFIDWDGTTQQNAADPGMDAGEKRIGLQEDADAGSPTPRLL
jgi:hypothetical protein